MEHDGEEYVASADDYLCTGYGDTIIEAISALLDEIVSQDDDGEEICA